MSEQKQGWFSRLVLGPIEVQDGPEEDAPRDDEREHAEVQDGGTS